MKAKDIYFKTMKFVWMKLALGGAITLVSVILLALAMLIGGATGSTGGATIAICLWIILTAGIYRFAMYYVGYMIKAGHVAVIAETVTSGQVPSNQFEFGKNAVKSRFAASNVYFAIDRLVSGAVSQIQKVIGKVGDALSVIPGIGFVASLAQTFVGIALNYVDECCLGYCFLKKDEGAFKASCDGVVIYYQNAKTLMKSAAVTTISVIILTFVAWLVPFLLFLGLFSLLNWSIFAAIVLAIIVAIVLKTAFIDSWMMVKMMTSYMEVAPNTEITHDLYGKLCKISNKFKSLFDKSEQESQTVTT